ncbi:MAG TPA: hypothetical protein VLE95_01115 [Chlamydiales bacterium]|nr:hypothetical protein [Chlamydiales bacterium]
MASVTFSDLNRKLDGWFLSKKKSANIQQKAYKLMADRLNDFSVLPLDLEEEKQFFVKLRKKMTPVNDERGLKSKKLQLVALCKGLERDAEDYIDRFASNPISVFQQDLPKCSEIEQHVETFSDMCLDLLLHHPGKKYKETRRAVIALRRQCAKYQSRVSAIEKSLESDRLRAVWIQRNRGAGFFETIFRNFQSLSKVFLNRFS